MGLPKLKIPPEFCYYAFNDKEPEQVPCFWKIVQEDRGHFENTTNIPQELKLLLQKIEDSSVSQVEVLNKMHEIFSAALMQGYETMEDLVENTGASDRVEEIRNILIPFLPKKMKPFVADHHRGPISPSPRPRAADRPRRP